MDEDFSDPRAQEIYLETLRRLSPQEKLDRVFAYDRQARELRLAGLRSEHPNASDDELQSLLVRERLQWNNPNY